MSAEVMLRSRGVLGEKKFAFGAHIAEQGKIPRCELVGGDHEEGERRQARPEEVCFHGVRSRFLLRTDFSFQHDEHVDVAFLRCISPSVRAVEDEPVQALPKGRTEAVAEGVAKISREGGHGGREEDRKNSSGGRVKEDRFDGVHKVLGAVEPLLGLFGGEGGGQFVIGIQAVAFSLRQQAVVVRIERTVLHVRLAELVLDAFVRLWRLARFVEGGSGGVQHGIVRA
jgi:hypothetical protein